MDRIVVGIAEGKTARCGQELISYGLGSCVGICLYDAQVKLAGMAHIILPHKGCATDAANAYKFADEGIRALLAEMAEYGAHRRRLTAKIAGGARMFATGNARWEIGENNLAVVRQTLMDEKIRILSEDTGKNYGRTILFSADDGKLTVSTVRHTPIII